MKSFRTLATLVSVSLLAVSFGPIAVAAPQSATALPSSKTPLNGDNTAPMVRGFIVQGEGQALVASPKFATSSTFAGKSLRWSKGLGSLGRTLRLDTPVSGATATRMISELKSQLGTDAIYPDQKFELLATESQSGAPWGLDRIDQVALPLSGSYNYPFTGEGVDAYVVDTGISETHSDFGDRVEPGWTAYSGDLATVDCDGHGTHVAGTIGGEVSGVAKDVTLIPIKVFSCDDDGAYTSDIAAGINWAIADHAASGNAAVMNLSLGGSKDRALNSAVKAAYSAGITVVVASGNEGVDACTTSPASETTAITVNASTRFDDDANFSNYGKCTDIYAPGVDIISAANYSDSAFQTLSGTSMASPHVAGVAALVLETSPAMQPKDVWASIAATSTAISWYYTRDDAKLLLKIGAEFATTVTPIVTGSATEGSTLRVATGTWSPVAKFTYQWYANGSPISRATKATYRIAKADIGKTISVVVTGTAKGYYPASLASAATATVAPKSGGR